MQQTHKEIIMKKKTLFAIIPFCLALFSIGFIATVQAAPQIQPQMATPKTVLSAVSMAKPAQCAAGFTPINLKLVEHEGKKWYQYDCVQQKVIKRSCNADTEVIKVKNQFVSLPSDGQSDNSKMYLSYSCFNYVPVK